MSKADEIWKDILIRNASRSLNINIGTIIRCCKGEFKTAGGYIWQYKNKQ